MTNDNHYIADEGKTFIRLIDGKVMGNDLYLGLFVDGSEDTIDNYKEDVDSLTQPVLLPLLNEGITSPI